LYLKRGGRRGPAPRLAIIRPAMGALETVTGLTQFERRGAGSDSERRAANWLRDQLEARNGAATIEPFWYRPNWALAHAWHVGLGLAGSLLAVGSARVGGALILVALVSIFADALLGYSPGRRLTPEHASQNVVSTPPDIDRPKRVRLIITANYDAGRAGVVFRDRPRAAAARVSGRSEGVSPGWLGWIAIALLWLEVTAIIRLGGTGGTGIGLAQLLPTVGLVLSFASLIDVASAEFSPAAGDNATGVAVAIALARALGAAPPRNAHVELVLQGGSDGTAIGLRHHLKTHKDERKATNTVVLGVSPCTAGDVHWWTSDGPLIPLRYFGQLRQHAAQIARQEPGLHLDPHHGRGTTPALAARIRRLPAITIGALDERGLAPRSHQMADTADQIDPATLDRAVEAALLLVDKIDAGLGEQAAPPVAKAAAT
jgi:Peptidase family M28